jgi:hypothetical protein
MLSVTVVHCVRSVLCSVDLFSQVWKSRSLPPPRARTRPAGEILRIERSGFRLRARSFDCAQGHACKVAGEGARATMSVAFPVGRRMCCWYCVEWTLLSAAFDLYAEHVRSLGVTCSPKCLRLGRIQNCYDHRQLPSFARLGGQECPPYTDGI